MLCGLATRNRKENGSWNKARNCFKSRSNLKKGKKKSKGWNDGMIYRRKENKKKP